MISDQYMSKTVVRDDGTTHTGIVGSGGRREIVVMKADATQVRIPRDEVDEIVPSSISAMPTGLLDRLTASEVHELLAYLQNPPSVRRFDLTRRMNAP